MDILFVFASVVFYHPLKYRSELMAPLWKCVLYTKRLTQKLKEKESETQNGMSQLMILNSAYSIQQRQLVIWWTLIIQQFFVRSTSLFLQLIEKEFTIFDLFLCCGRSAIDRVLYSKYLLNTLNTRLMQNGKKRNVLIGKFKSRTIYIQRTKVCREMWKRERECANPKK